MNNDPKAKVAAYLKEHPGSSLDQVLKDLDTIDADAVELWYEKVKAEQGQGEEEGDGLSRYAVVFAAIKEDPKVKNKALYEMLPGAPEASVRTLKVRALAELEKEGVELEPKKSVTAEIKQYMKDHPDCGLRELYQEFKGQMQESSIRTVFSANRPKVEKEEANPKPEAKPEPKRTKEAKKEGLDGEAGQAARIKELEEENARLRDDLAQQKGGHQDQFDKLDIILDKFAGLNQKDLTKLLLAKMLMSDE